MFPYQVSSNPNLVTFSAISGHLCQEKKISASSKLIHGSCSKLFVALLNLEYHKSHNYGPKGDDEADRPLQRRI